MILKTESEKEKIFVVSSADWEVAVKAVTRNDACVLAIREVYEKFNIMDNKRKTEGIIIDLFRTLEASRRKNNI